MKKYKEKAKWIPNVKLFIKQILVSVFSYLTLPLFREKKNGIQEFFKIILNLMVLCSMEHHQVTFLELNIYPIYLPYQKGGS